MISLYAKQKKRHRCIEETFGLCGRRRGWDGCFKRTASKHVYYQGWNRSPAQVGCMRQALGPGALGRPIGSGWRGRWEGGSGWGIHVNPWLILDNVWQKPLHYVKVISLQLIKKKDRQKNDCRSSNSRLPFLAINFGQAPGVDDGQGGLAYCGSWGHKESDTTEGLNWGILVAVYLRDA